MKPYKLGKGGGRRWGKIGMFLAVVVVIAVIGAYFGIRNIYEHNLKPVDPSSTEQVGFTISLGESAPQIAAGLAEKNLIRSSRAFVQYVRSNELAEKFIAGTYKLQRSLSVQEIVTILTEGRVASDLFTIYPGQRIEDVRETFITEGGFTATQVDAALNPTLYADHPALVDKPEGASLEGYLYPDSYERIAETKPETIVRQALNEMAEALTPDIRAGIAAQGLSVYQGIILASIVEREVGAVDKDGKATDNRAKAAQVFLKRLEMGMMLQSNATDNHPEAYDTYSIEGLPPGPISNVSSSSLRAIANPSKTDFLYFVAGKDCVTRFSHTVEQHDALKLQHGVAAAEDNCRG